MPRGWKSLRTGVVVIVGMLIAVMVYVRAQERGKPDTTSSSVSLEVGEIQSLPPEATPDPDPDPLPAGAVARLGTTRWREGQFVFAVACSPDGTLIASGGGLKEVHLWSAETGRRVRTLPVEGVAPGGLHFTPDGRFLTALSSWKNLWVWEVSTGRFLHCIGPPTQRISSADPQAEFFSKRNPRVYRLEESGVVRAWDIPTGDPVEVLPVRIEGAAAFAVSPDENRLVAAWSQPGMRGSSSVRWWDLGTGEEGPSLSGGEGAVSSLCFSPDGGVVAGVSRRSGPVRWSLPSGGALPALSGGRDFIRTMEFSPDGARLASGDGRGILRIYDTGNGEEALSLPMARGTIWSLAWSPDGRKLAAGGEGGTVGVWEADSGKRWLDFAGHRSSVVALTWSADGKRLASIAHETDPRILVWETETWKPWRTLTSRHLRSSSLAFSPEGRSLAAGNGQGLGIWDLQGTAHREIGNEMFGVCSVSYNGKGDLLALSNGASKVELWTVDPPQLVWRVASHKGTSFDLRFSPDDSRILSRTWSGRIASREAAGGEEVESFEIDPRPSSGGALSRDTTLIAVCGQLRQASEEELKVNPRVTTVAEPVVRVLERTTRRERWVLRGHTQVPVSACFSPDGRLLASAGRGEKSIRVWRIEDGACVAVLDGQESGVTTVSFSPEGRWLAAGGVDTTILVWDASPWR
ncbi:MAG: WD40 repeat domain-containing protein [Planctomycetes bacterium]|nr:WD40 repeat domain-containing protein [Planctomycetota bacterium]